MDNKNLAISIKNLNDEQDRILTKLKQVAIDKGHDYNGKQQVQGDTLYNLRVPSILGICDDPIQTCLMNAANKIMRLSSLRTTDPAVKGESFMDSVEDCINYIIYAGLFYKEKIE